MKLMAIDTATEQCSAAIAVRGDKTAVWMRTVPTARAHAELILPMIDELLTESGLSLADLDGLAFGRGPGSFTGVRIGVSVIQGLALARNLRVVGISDLAAVAHQAALKFELPVGTHILVTMDARMGEVYWGQYSVTVVGRVELFGDEHVSAPGAVQADPTLVKVGVGTGWRTYPEMIRTLRVPTVDDTLLPRAVDVVTLAFQGFADNQSVKASDARPVYLRDRVVTIDS